MAVSSKTKLFKKTQQLNTHTKSHSHISVYYKSRKAKMAGFLPIYSDFRNEQFLEYF